MTLETDFLNRWSDAEYFRAVEQRDAAIFRAEAAERSVYKLWERLTFLEVKIGCEEAKAMQAKRELAAAQERMRAMQWRPIAEYDAMDRREFRAVFLFPRVMLRPGDLPLPMLLLPDRRAGRRVCTHFLQLPPVPGGE